MDKITQPLPSAASLPPALFRGLVEAAPLAITITDAAGRILYVNPAFTRITGYLAEEMIGNSPSLLSYKVTPREVYEGMWSNITAGQAWQGQLVNRRKDGARYVADLSITPICDDAGEITYHLGLHQDVTELHVLSERLQNQKRLTESIIDLAPVAVVLLDGQERVVLDNQEYKKLMGSFGQTEPAHAVLAALRAEMGEADWANMQHKGEFSNRLLRFDRAGAGGPSWYALSGSWFGQSDTSADSFFTTQPNRYLMLVISDISELKRQQQSQWLQALRTMLAESELVDRLRETLAGAAFQLAGPLNVIAAAEKRLALRLPACDAALEALGEARKQGETALVLLKSATPTIPPEAWQPANCNELLHDVLQLLTDRLLAEGVVVEWRPALRLPPVEAQAVALRAALAQLVNNALDALHESRDPKRELKLTTRATRDGVELEISDSGPGIPEALRLRVFEPFFTTRPGGARAGMGLTMAQETIRRHQGTLDIDPNHSAGCRIIVHLPVIAEVRHV